MHKGTAILYLIAKFFNDPSNSYFLTTLQNEEDSDDEGESCKQRFFVNKLLQFDG